MRFLAHPNKGVNDIEFGMTAAMVRKRMSGRLDTGDYRAASKEHPTDFYPDIPVFFYYDEEGHLDSIEFCAGADVLVGTVNVLKLKAPEAIAFLRRLDPSVVVSDDGAASHQIGLAIWVPLMGEGDEEDEDFEENDRVETILFGAPGSF